MKMAREVAAQSIDPGDFPSSSDTEALYARIVNEIRDSGLSTADIARLVGVAERQVRNWTSGGNTPSGRRWRVRSPRFARGRVMWTSSAIRSL